MGIGQPTFKMTSFSMIQNALLLLALALLTFRLLRAVYRLTLHPLARFPGPFLSRISSISIPLQAASGDRHLRQLQEHRKYGPIVRIGPNSLSFSSPTALRTIYQSSRLQNQLRKSDYYKTIDAPAGAYSTHSEVGRRKHAFRRRVLDQAFSEASMRSAEEFVINNVDTLCGLLSNGDSWSQPRRMDDYATYFVYDVMGDLVFGKPFDCMTNAEHRFVPKMITESSKFLYVFVARRLISCEPLMHWLGGQAARDEYHFVAYAAARMKERIAKEEEKDVRKDMMHYILNAKDPVTSRSLTQLELEAETSLLIAAGADTTSSSLAAAFHYLTLPSSKPVLDYLQRQLRKKFSVVSFITWSALKNHTYLRAVVEEIVRLLPAVPSELPRTIMQKPGIDIAGEFIPAGTTVGCSAFVLAHDAEAYPSPYAFKPERWIPKDAETHLAEVSPLQDPEQIAKAREAFCAFSLGSRGCVGKQLAYMELCLVLARVLWTFDMRRAVEQVSVRTKGEAERKGLRWYDDEYQVKDVFLTAREGPLVEFRKHQTLVEA
ncbi:hypothetical protein LTR24_009066 [Lithohypha guttulata]|uniref:Cytochrome P450 n=1 Tax=Lithohypha guttulata TaxID=1690604 RepID=A0ABR0JY50_9EURO|nr:hypothetical protein LTR24_009066 [Lithohypha guttulata]